MAAQRQLALISVSDKTGLAELAKGLFDLGFEILSTGGTARLISKMGVKCTEVSEYTNFPEILDGRVKTLHPKIHGGILGDSRKKNHIDQMLNHDIAMIPIVVVNLYPFFLATQKPSCSIDEAIENIDIGGPTLIRAAAKNWENVGVITSSHRYEELLSKLRKTDGIIDKEYRFTLAKEAFAHTAAYDGMISNYLSAKQLGGDGSPFPTTFNLQYSKKQDLRYGENPHQKSAFYLDNSTDQRGLGEYKQLNGKELSFNNIVDTDTAWECVKTFKEPSCVIVKHANPCGVAKGKSSLIAYDKAFLADPTSAFGGIVAFNSEVDEKTALAVNKTFVEVVIAPKFSAEAFVVLKQKVNIRLLELTTAFNSQSYDIKKINGGLLVQTPDNEIDLSEKQVTCPTKRKPNQEEKQNLIFAWQVSKFVKSNAIVFCKNDMTMGVGAGQMSRIDSVKIAAMKAERSGLRLRDTVVASDAFFPFPDALEELARVGARAVIQPGGSIKDKEVISAADNLGLAMIFTGKRHFKH